MRKINMITTLGVIACAGCLFSAPAICEDNIFGNLTTTPPAASEIQQTTVKVEQPIVVRGSSQMNKQESLTTQSLQNTVASLEAAQTDLRTKLETAKSNYIAVDQEFKKVKQERAALKKIVRQTNSRIKSLERSKKNVQKAIQANL